MRHGAIKETKQGGERRGGKRVHRGGVCYAKRDLEPHLYAGCRQSQNLLVSIDKLVNANRYYSSGLFFPSSFFLSSCQSAMQLFFFLPIRSRADHWLLSHLCRLSSLLCLALAWPCLALTVIQGHAAAAKMSIAVGRGSRLTCLSLLQSACISSAATHMHTRPILGRMESVVGM